MGNEVPHGRRRQRLVLSKFEAKQKTDFPGRRANVSFAVKLYVLVHPNTTQYLYACPRRRSGFSKNVHENLATTRVSRIPTRPPTNWVPSEE